MKGHAADEFQPRVKGVRAAVVVMCSAADFLVGVGSMISTILTLNPTAPGLGQSVRDRSERVQTLSNLRSHVKRDITTITSCLWLLVTWIS